MAALVAMPVLGEFPAPKDWIGIALISAGVYLAAGGPLPRHAATSKSRAADSGSVTSVTDVDN